MNLHQFKFVQEAVRRNLNLTEAAKALHTSQPGVSKAILELEQELGIDIFTRHGKRLKRVTEPGQQVLHSIERILAEVNNLKRIGEQYSQQDRGTLSIAATHTQARYVLPKPVAQLRTTYPLVNVSMHQGAPGQVAQMVLDEVADIKPEAWEQVIRASLSDKKGRAMFIGTPIFSASALAASISRWALFRVIPLIGALIV